MPDMMDEMEEVLRRNGLENCTNNFIQQKISPDIICCLSEHDLQHLGVSNKTDMVKLRNDCIKYGSTQPLKMKKYAGPPEFEINQHTLAKLLGEGFQISDIAKLLSVSERTIYRRMQQFGISKFDFSDMSSDDLDNHVSDLIKQFPFCGESLLGQMLRSRGVLVQRCRLRESIHRLDEVGVGERRKGRLHRRIYNVKGPNHLWHIDTNHKLIRWKLIIAGGIDGFSRMVTFLKCTDNNQAETLLQCFTTAVTKYGLPLRVRSDKGLENVAIAEFMISKRGTANRSMITGKSVHNQRIERLWRDVYTGVLAYYYQLFFHMEDAGLLDPLNDKHIAALHYVFLPKINEKLQVWETAWAGHRLRTVGSSPRVLWISGQLQYPVGVDVEDTDLYGVEGFIDTIPGDDVDGQRPIIDPTACRVLNVACRQELESNISSSWTSSNFGMDAYSRALDIINIHSD